MSSVSRPMTAERAPLEGDHFDVVVIGGGISGVAIARQCARSGKRVLLVEQQDFAAGTTSRSTRIIHGGLRYLEYGDIVQVRHSLKERQSLLRHYPHLVRPMEFLLPLNSTSKRSALAVRAGLWIYRQMGGEVARERDESQLHKLERMLDAGHRFSLFSFDDAQCEFPERLVTARMLEAADSGCVVRNHTEVLNVEVHERRVRGVLLRDVFSKKEERISCAWVINATGPWADRICQSSALQTRNPMVGGVRGSHIVLSKFEIAPGAAIYTEAADGRAVFVIPWNDQLLVGTTEVEDHGDPVQVHPSCEEINYLLQTFRRLFPNITVSVADVHYAFAGVRPLPYSPGTNPSTLTRRHRLHDHADDGAQGMISVIGGKLTTAGWVARECATKIGIRSDEPSLAVAPFESELDGLLQRRVEALSSTADITHDTARGLMEWFGERSSDIADAARKVEPLRAPLCPHTHHIVAEALHALSKEHAFTLADVLLRRVPVALSGSWSSECTRIAANRIGAVAGWDEKRIGIELETFEAELQRFLRKPSHLAC